jgi:peroxiredoxin
MRIAVFILLFGLLAFSPVPAQLKESGDILLVGEDMPEFTVLTLDRKEISSDDLYGKVVLINFFATWCPPCNQELPHLEKEVWAKYKDREDFMLMIIDREEPGGKVEEFVKKKGFTMPFYLDPNREVYNLFAEKNIPRNYLFDKQGRLVLQSSGFKKQDFNTMLKELDKLLK